MAKTPHDRASHPKRVPSLGISEPISHVKVVQPEPWDPRVKQLNTVSAETINPGSWEGEPLRHVGLGDVDSHKEHQEKYLAERHKKD